MPPRPPSLIISRAFSSSRSMFGRPADKRLEKLHREVPEYPYGARHWYKQSNFGLYAGTHIQFGNNISKDFELKTRRRWEPNVQSRRLWSESLQQWLRIKVATRVLRTIDKVGGLDEYLLGEKPARIKELGMGGWLLRWRIMQTDTVKKRFAEQRKALGLPDVEERAGSDVQPLTEQKEKKQVVLWEYGQKPGRQDDAVEGLHDGRAMDGVSEPSSGGQNVIV